MSIKSLLDNILNKNADGVTADFTAIMNEKVAEAIDAKRIEVAQSMLKPQNEETEELDEANFEKAEFAGKTGKAWKGIGEAPAGTRKIKGTGYGSQYDTDEDGDEVTKSPAAPTVKRGRGRPKKDAGQSGEKFNTDAISALMKARMGTLPKGKSRKIVEK